MPFIQCPNLPACPSQFTAGNLPIAIVSPVKQYIGLSLQNIKPMAKSAGSDLLSGSDTSIGAMTANLSSEVWNSTGTFTQSAVYSGIAEPILGVAQIVDKTAGTQTMTTAKDALSYCWVTEPQKAKNSTDWHAQMLGNAVGMMLPYLLLHKAVRTGASSAFGAQTMAVRGNIAAMSAKELGGLVMREASLGFTTGFVNDAVFRPSNNNLNGKSFVGDRVLNGVSGGATMATLTGSSLGLARLATSEVIKGSLVKSVLSIPVGTGVLSAVPSGLVSAESQALRQGKIAPTASEAAEHIYQMAFVGGALGTAHKFGMGGRNDLKYQDAARVLSTGPIEGMETPVMRAERLKLAKDMEQSKDLVFAQIRGKDGGAKDVVIRPFEDDSRSLMRLHRANITGAVDATLQSMAGVPSSSLPLVLRDKVSIPLTDQHYNVTMSKPGLVMIQQNGGKQLGTQIREWANERYGPDKSAPEGPVGSVTALIQENTNVASLVGRAAFDNLYKGNVDLVEFSQQTIPQGKPGVALKPTPDLRLVSIDNKNDFTLLQEPSWGFGSQFGLSLEVAKALEGKRLSEVSPKLQKDAEAMLGVFSSPEGTRTLLASGLTPPEIEAAQSRLTSLVNNGFPKHLGEMNAYADKKNSIGLTASMSPMYGIEMEAVHDYQRVRDGNLVLMQDGGPLRIENNPEARKLVDAKKSSETPQE